jgi:glycosyltransferase involved in cell wall biosynthesis
MKETIRLFKFYSLKTMRILYRISDFLMAVFISVFFIPVLVFYRFIVKTKAKRNILLSLSKDSIQTILQCNGDKYFDWDFTRPCAKYTVILYTGNMPTRVIRVGKKVIGINYRVPLEKLKKYLPFTVRIIQQFIGYFASRQIITKLSSKVVEVMFPSKLALRALLLKLTCQIKLVTQVRGNIDLIYYFNPFPTFLPFQIKNRLIEPIQIAWDKMVSMCFFRVCDLVIGYNINNMLSAISSGAHPNKTRLSRIKVEPSMMSEVKACSKDMLKGFPKNGRVIILWSRLSPEKLVLEVMQAFEVILDKSKDKSVNLVIIGDGPERENLYRYQLQSKYTHNIHLLGYKDRTFIASAAKLSDLVVVPYGGSSLVEAVFLERPVVAFDIEWHNELIIDGETGWLADFPDVHDLAEKMSIALSSNEEAQSRAKKAKLKAEKMFNFETIDQKEEKYLKPLFEN